MEFIHVFKKRQGASRSASVVMACCQGSSHHRSQTYLFNKYFKRLRLDKCQYTNTHTHTQHRTHVLWHLLKLLIRELGVLAE